MSSTEQRNNTTKYADEPIYTIGSSPTFATALLIDNQAYGDTLTTFAMADPAPTLRSDKQGAYRAFLADTQPHSRDVLEIAYADRPALTVRADYATSKYRAFLVSGQNGGREITIRYSDEPTMTITNSSKGLPSACVGGVVGGVVVKMNVPCLARWQSMPDAYLLPESNTLASRIIGNGVPSLLGRKILETLT